MKEELHRYLVEELGRSFVTIPFSVWFHICEKTRQSVSSRFPKLKLPELTEPLARLWYARYAFHCDDNCISFLKSVITAYPDADFPEEVNQLIGKSYVWEKLGKRRAALGNPNPAEGNNQCKKLKLVDYDEDVRFGAAESVCSAASDLPEQDDEGSGGRGSPDLRFFQNPEPPIPPPPPPPLSILNSCEKRIEENDGGSNESSNPCRGEFVTNVGRTSPPTPFGLNPSCNPETNASKSDGVDLWDKVPSPVKGHLLDPRLARKTPKVPAPPSVADSESTRSFCSDTEVHENARKSTAKITTDDDEEGAGWKMWTIAPYPRSRNHRAAPSPGFETVTRRHVENRGSDPDPRLAGTRPRPDYPRTRDEISEEERRIQSDHMVEITVWGPEPAEVRIERQNSTETICLSDDSDRNPGPAREDDQDDPLKWKLSVTPNGSPFSYMGDQEDRPQSGLSEEEVEDKTDRCSQEGTDESVVVESGNYSNSEDDELTDESSSEGEEIDETNFAQAYERPRRQPPGPTNSFSQSCGPLVVAEQVSQTPARSAETVGKSPVVRNRVIPPPPSISSVVTDPVDPKEILGALPPPGLKQPLLPSRGNNIVSQVGRRPELQPKSSPHLGVSLYGNFNGQSRPAAPLPGPGIPPSFTSHPPPLGPCGPHFEGHPVPMAGLHYPPPNFFNPLHPPPLLPPEFFPDLSQPFHHPPNFAVEPPPPGTWPM